jgi:hypothetical protein
MKAPFNKEVETAPFDELMVTWNASRPLQGAYHFYISVKADHWSPWLRYATWGNEGQQSYKETSEKGLVKVYQDAFTVTDGKKGSAFRIKIETEGDAHSEGVWAMHVYTNSDKQKIDLKKEGVFESVSLPVEGLSQMALDHMRFKDLCSPTSTTAVVRFLSGHKALNPLAFAVDVWDKGFDIYGNWVFNAAEAAALLGTGWNVWVDRLPDFAALHRLLKEGTPVVVSVRGPLPGSALPYAGGHLIAITGYDAINRRVLSVDPAFPSDQETKVFYPLEAFLEAWDRRGNLAYVFRRAM